MTRGAITRVPGFQAVGVACGLKASGNKDLALILADSPCRAAATFTQNAFQAAPVLYDRALLKRTGGQNLRAVLINAGNANACTGEQGDQDTAQMAQWAEASLGLPPDSVFIMSTGVIGAPLPMDKIRAGIEAASAGLSITPEAGHSAAEAIMTTDLLPKEALVKVDIDGRTVSIGGIAKGSGMIHPNMATMLATLVTDAHLTPADLNAALRQAVERSFNRISVDGDTSTNDTVLLLASGRAQAEPLAGRELAAFSTALQDVCIRLAKMIARDGEGATKLLEITVSGAVSEAEAAQAAATIATSPLVKTAFFGNDPNWGRIVAAVGRSGATVEPHRTALAIRAGQLEVALVAEGQPLSFDAAALSSAMAMALDVFINVDLGLGEAQATYWTCDFSYQYVEINAEYHT